MRKGISAQTRRGGLLAALSLVVPLAALGLAALPAPARVTHAGAAQSSLLPITVNAAAPHLPKSIPAGVVALTLVNNAKQAADATMARINPGATLVQIRAANKDNSLQGFIRLSQLLTFVGGPTAVPPGGRETTILDLRTPGRYGLSVSLGNNSGGKPIFVTVTPGPGQHAVLPRGTVTINLDKMRFLNVPAHVAAGDVTFQLVNKSQWIHEANLARLDPGKTQQDVINFLKTPNGLNGPPPAWVHDLPGLDPLSGKQTASFTVHLTPGYYVLLCFMPDVKKNGTPHVAEGMLNHFVVQ
jgi:hypothetical protein